MSVCLSLLMEKKRMSIVYLKRTMVKVGGGMPQCIDMGGGHWCCQLQGTSICLKTSCPLGYLEEKMEMSGATLGAGYLRTRIEVCCISISTSFRDLIFLVLLCICMLCITLRTPKRKGVIGIMYNLQEAA